MSGRYYNTDREFVLTLSPGQARIVQKALNFYSRSFLGQVDLIHLGLGFKASSEVAQVLKKHLLPPGLQDPGSSYGLFSTDVPNEAREAVDIHDVIRHEFWKQKPENQRSRYTVDSDTPFQKGTYPLPKLSVIEKDPND